MKLTSMKIFSSSSLRSVLRMNYLIRQNISANDLISKTKLNRTTLNSKAFATQSCRQKEIKIVGDSVSGKIKNDQIKVLYDGQCPLCVTEINLMKKLNKKENTVKFIDITMGEYNPEDHLGITYQQAMGKMHVIDKDKRIYDSMEAMNVLYNAVGLKWLSRFLTLPGVKEASDIVYPWFAINRYRLTGRNREECESGRCRISDRQKTR